MDNSRQRRGDRKEVNTMVRVWGIAQGRGTTERAAPGAFTWREYPTETAARQAEGDWRVILMREIEEG